MDYKNSEISRYLDDLAARLPAPGGGSAAALSASLGAALISMVVNFTIGKPKYARYEKELKTVLEKSEGMRLQFLNLMDLDVLAYNSKNLRDALDVPFMTARLCYEGIRLCPPLVKKGNIRLISDVAVAAALLEAGFSAACFNVIINLKLIRDKKLSRAVIKELTYKKKQINKIRSQTEVKIGEIIGR